MYQKGNIVESWGVRYRITAVHGGYLMGFDLDGKLERPYHVLSVDQVRPIRPFWMHYGNIPCTRGTVINWQGTRYRVAFVSQWAEGHYTYYVKRLRGTRLYMIEHYSGYMRNPRRLAR